MKPINRSNVFHALCVFLLMSPILAADGHTNGIPSPALNAHQRFYVNYRAQKARFEKGISDIKAAGEREREYAAAKTKAGAPIEAEARDGIAMKNRIGLIQREIAKLEVSRLDYERAHPDAIQYRGFTPPPIRGPNDFVFPKQ